MLYEDIVPASLGMSASGLVSRVLPVHTAVRNCTREARKRIAAKLLERASHGERTLKGFTDAAMAAAVITTSKKSEPFTSSPAARP